VNVRRTVEGIRRAYDEFLTLPSLVIVALLLIAAGAHALDRSRPAWLEPARAALIAHVFSNSQATQQLLATVAGGIITITSITISLLLIALQQSAGSMTAQVFDQYIRRWYNQAYFGYFVGISLYVLLTLATVNAPFNPVFGGALAFAFACVALYLLIVLLYSTINQMRPEVIIESVHDYVLSARLRQRKLLARTRRISAHTGPVEREVRTGTDGFLTHIGLDAIAAALGDREVEVVLAVSIGSYAAHGDTVAHVNARSEGDAAAVAPAVERALHFERKRNIRMDPAYGIAELETIGWTSVSSSKSNPAPGLLTVQNLRDVLARWSEQTDPDADPQSPLPIVYHDTTCDGLIDAFESLAVASSESMQHMVFAAVVTAFARTFDRLRPGMQRRAESMILRILATLGDHAPTRELDAALEDLVLALRTAQRAQTADAVDRARVQLNGSAGALHSRSNRASEQT
jgi:uncharacterized membrane protein